MRLPALIRPIDKTHCSMNCQFIRFHQCTARGDDQNQAETLDREGPHYLRTDYCRQMASDQWQVIETCPKCKGRCEGEHHSYHTVCIKCGTKFKRIEDQDENYLREEK